jgi:alkylation response protein AidB-like acyl-CoA dehydrogenase
MSAVPFEGGSERAVHLVTGDVEERTSAFRAEVRAWLATHEPPVRAADVPLDQVMFNNYADLEEWAKQVHEAGLMCATWPRDHGGRGLSQHEAVALHEEFARAGAPLPTRGLGESLVGPTLLQWGTAEQKSRLLPRIVDGTHRYCQGFSEPNAGSDLRSIATRGDVDGDTICLTGQKIWTSAASNANMIFCLCRTVDPGAGRDGITFVIVPMRHGDGSANGVEVRPIRQPTGIPEFAEVFLDGARAPLDNVIGGLNNGWRVAMTTLGSERAGASTLHVPFDSQFWRLVALARANGATAHPAYRQELARAYTDVELMRFNGLRIVAADLADQSPATAGEVIKLHWSEHAARLAGLSTNLRGAQAMLCGDLAGSEPDEWGRCFLFSPGYTIAGGTSEVLRDVIGERSLGLPRHQEPKAGSRDG